MTAALIEEARQHLVLHRPIAITCPAHLLHGQRDPAVPWQTSIELSEKLQSEAVIVELIKAGDHRLSSAADIDRICAAIAAKVTAG